MAFQAHELRYFKKHGRGTPQPIAQPTPSPSPNTIEGLVGFDLVTETPTVSVSVKVGGIKSAHIILANVTNWDIQSNKLIISSDDSEVLTLVFINITEAQLGLDRFEIAMNGGVI